MKKVTVCAISLIAIFACALITACTKPGNIDIEPVFIKADDKGFDFNGKTVLDYMNYLQDEGELTFVIGSNGMVVSINGKNNDGNYYWMLYTDDTENSNYAWGTYEHEDVTYLSAAVGVGELRVVENRTYIWVYRSCTL